METDMTTLTLLSWAGDLVACVTALAMLKDTALDFTALRQMLGIGRALLAARPPEIAHLRLLARFLIRTCVLVTIAASAGVCLAFPPDICSWQEMVLRLALVIHLASQVPCPWLRWISIGDRRAKLNDPPGIERRAGP